MEATAPITTIPAPPTIIMFPSPNPMSNKTVAAFRVANSHGREFEPAWSLWESLDREASSPPIMS